MHSNAYFSKHGCFRSQGVIGGLCGGIPIQTINKLPKELETRDMLIPAGIILDSILEDRADIPINTIHMHSGLKAETWFPQTEYGAAISIL